MSSYVTAEVPREKLKQLIEKNGDSLLNDPDRTEALLRDHCGPHRKEISALVGALEERVPLELKSSWQSAMTPEAMRARLVQRLEENRGLSTDVAGWAVDAWSYALGVGLARRSDPVVELPAAAAGAAGAEAADGAPTKSVAERVASDRAGGAVVTPDNGKNGIHAAFNTPKKAGIGAVVALGLAAGAFAMFHQPTPPPQNGGGSGQQPGQQQPGQQQPGQQQPRQQQPSQQQPGQQSGQQQPSQQQPSGQHPSQQQPGTEQGRGNGPQGRNSGDGITPAVSHSAPVQAAFAIPSGTPIPVRVDRELNSEDLNEGDLVDATVSSPVTVNGDVVIRTGARAHLRVVSIDRTGETNGTQHLRLALVDVVTERGRVNVTSRSHDFAGPKASQDAVKRGAVGGAVGAVGGFVVGHLFHHGGAGAAAGAGTGAVAGVVTAKAGPVKIASETPMQFLLTSAVHQ